ncbi:ABC transporter substrate-binding protein [Spirillospora sp. NPDC047279]|uniref:ABC transporter substrate-binding protein n=1 Tax=Spirillospora sp. NPDC047279 TaxID=3155478 RepID=UPI0033F3A1FC
MITGSLRRGVVATAALALTGLLALSACGESADEKGDGNNAGGAAAFKPVKAGKISVCTNLPYPPFQFDQGGKTVGFDVSMIDLVAKKLNVTQEIVNIDFAAIKGGSALNAGRCDVAAAGMTITDERKASLDFSRPYFPEYITLLIKKGGTAKSLDDVKSQNLKLGVQADTTSLEMAKAKGLKPREYKDSEKQRLALVSGQIDAVLQDTPVVNDWLKKSDVSNGFAIAADIATGAQYGFAVKKGGNPVLLKTINETITETVGNGQWAALYKQWVGSEPKSKPAES